MRRRRRGLSLLYLSDEFAPAANGLFEFLPLGGIQAHGGSFFDEV